MAVAKTFLLFLLVFLTTYKIIFSQMVDPDVWFHIQSGFDIIFGHVDYNNYYWSETTQSYNDMKYTWLGDCILYLTHNAYSVFGLICLRAAAVFSCCFFLFLTSDKKTNFLKIIIMLLLVCAIYQKMLIRNSMFALFFLPAMLYALSEKKHVVGGLIILVWSFCHGSFLLGIGIYFLHVVGDMIDNRSKNLIPLICFVLLFSIILYVNPVTTSYYSIAGIKNILAGNLFSKSPSVDYANPLKLDRIYINIALMIGIATIAIVKPKKFTYMIFIPIVFFGCKWVRMVGYVPIISAYLLFDAEKNGHLRTVDNNIYIICSLFLITYISTQTEKILYHISKPVPTVCHFKFPNRNAELALIEHLNENTFTTVSNGAYLLRKWYPHKKVYIDTHWNPHVPEVFEDFKKYCINPNLLDCNSAIIGFSDFQVIKNFARSPEWNAKSIDRGSVLFVRQPSATRLLIRQNEIDEMNNIHKKSLVRVLSTCGVKITN